MNQTAKKNSISIQSKIQHLQHFIENVHQLDFTTTAEEHHKAINSFIYQGGIYQSYEDLYQDFKDLKEHDIEKNFSTNDIRVIEFLKLGHKYNQIFTALPKIIAATEFNHGAAVVEYIKTSKGYNASNSSNTMGAYSEDDLIAIFGSLLGVKITQECVEKFRAEKIGSIIGYALSGLAEKHIQDWKDTEHSEKLALADFISQKIKESDVSLHFKIEENGTDDILCAWIDVNENRTTDYRDRPRNVADHCFVSETNGQKTITLGFSTSNSSTQWQGTSFHSADRCLQELVKQETINKQQNPYFGATINRYYFSTGGILTNPDRLNETSAKNNKAGIQINALQNSIQSEAVGQMYLLSVLANCNTPQSILNFMQYNPVIAGTNTLDWHELQNTLKNQTDTEQLLAIRSFVLSKCNLTLDVLNSTELNKMGTSVVFGDLAEKTVALFKTVKQNILLPYSDSEYLNLLKPFEEKAETFCNKYNTNREGVAKQISNDLLEAVEYISQGMDDINKHNEKKLLRSTNTNIHIQNLWSDPVNTQIIYAPTAKIGPDNFKTTIPDMLTELLQDKVDKGLNKQTYVYWWFSKYVDLLKDVFNGSSAKEAYTKHFGNSYSVDRQEFAQNLNTMRNILQHMSKNKILKRHFSKVIDTTIFLTYKTSNLQDPSSKTFEDIDMMIEVFSGTPFKNYRDQAAKKRNDKMQQENPQAQIKSQYAQRKK